MVLDNLANCEVYCSLNDKFEKAFDFLKKATQEDLPVGKYEIDGDNVFGLVQEYATKFRTDGSYEAHEKYIDIQYLISGIEEIDVLDISKAAVEKEYDESIDAAFYKNNDKATRTILEAGDYAIFFPHDTHKPGLSYEYGASKVKKIVVKVKI